MVKLRLRAATEGARASAGGVDQHEVEFSPQRAKFRRPGEELRVLDAVAGETSSSPVEHLLFGVVKNDEALILEERGKGQ